VIQEYVCLFKRCIQKYLGVKCLHAEFCLKILQKKMINKTEKQGNGYTDTRYPFTVLPAFI
jgi:hypothetical protein